jgi:hypothetical protein
MLPVDVASLPLLLCGPILRRVDRRSVAVFVVLKEQRYVQLKLYANPHTFDSSGDFIDEPLHTGLILESLRLGEHFYAALATLSLAEANALTPGQQYAYNVFFHETDDGSGAFVSLAQHDFHLLTLDNEYRIGFAHEHLPGFVVPPSDLTQLKIVHGSCRKPHGEGIDMLASLDGVLAPNGAPVVASERPHLLLLTGDQIYADDVSPPLLRMLHEASNALLGWHETLDGTAPDGDEADAMTPELTALEQQVEAWNADTGTAAAVDLLDQLAGLVDAAVAGLTFTDDLPQNQLIHDELKRQLTRYADRARLGPSVDPAPASARLEELISSILNWFQSYKAIFLPLATNRSWGRVALVEVQGDRLVLNQIRDELQAVATSASADAAALLAQLDAALAKTVLGKDLPAWIAAARTGVSALAASMPLTSDEIVAHAQRLLDGWFVAQRPGFDYQPSRIAPPQRGLELKELARLTSDAMDSHLMFVGEFYMMYTFVWSDVLWPSIGRYAHRTFQMPPYFESVPNYPIMKSGLEDANETLLEFAAGLPKVRRVLANIPTLMMFDDHEVTDDWNLNEDWVTLVNNELAGAQVLRNALVSYAVFQDWGNQPEDYADTGSGSSRPLGRRLFDEIEYTPGPPGGDPPPPPPLYRDVDPEDPSSSVSRVNRILGTGALAVADLPGLTIDLDSLVPENESEVAYRIVPDTGRKQWDWLHEIPAPAGGRPVRVIALDTRTHRAFPDELWAAQAGIALDSTVLKRGKIAAACLINGAEMQRQLIDRLEPDALHLVISPAPVFGLPLIEDFLQRLQALTSGPEVADFESWQANPHGFGMLLTFLRNADCVLLSGDVHYAFSNLLSFPEDDPGTGAALPPKLLLQLCSSSMKNQTTMTQILGEIGREGRLAHFFSPALAEIRQVIDAEFADIPEIMEDLAGDFTNFKRWFYETAPILDAVTIYLKLKDAMLFSPNVPAPTGLLAVGSGIVAYVVGDLFNAESGEFERAGFTLNFLKDVRAPSDRLQRAIPLSGLAEHEIAGGVQTPERLEEMSEIVGYNNAARITFTGPGTSGDDVHQEILWHPHGEDNKPLPPVAVTATPVIRRRILASTIHGNIPPLGLLRFRIAELARREHQRWHPPSGEIRENDEAGLTILRTYKATMARYDAVLESANLGKFDDMVFTDDSQSAWSALFVSHVMHLAQVGEMWFHSPRHIDYVRAAYQNRALGITDNPFWLYKRDEAEAVVQVGDVIGGHDLTDADVQMPPENGPMIGTHWDIVVEVNREGPNPHIWVIGGNIESSEPGGGKAVTSNLRKRNLDANGRLTDSWMYGVIRVLEP